MAQSILAQSYMDLLGTPMFLAMTIRYLVVIFNPMANFDFECFRKYSCAGILVKLEEML